MPASEDQDGLRPYRASDLKEARLLIGSSAFEQLAAANYKAYRHPATLAFWLAGTISYIWLTNWWPSVDNPMSWLSPLIAAFTTSVPILLAFEWLHRGYFERLVRSTLSSTDLIAPETFYALSPSSSCLVYSHKGTIISVAAIDTAHAGEDLDALLGDEEEDKKKKGKAEKSETGLGESVGRTTAREPSMADIVALGGRKQDKSIGLLRHYHTDRLYINSPLPTDILTEAISRAFSHTSSLKSIYARDSPTAADKTALLGSLGFKRSSEGPRQRADESEEAFVGVFGWRKGWLKLERADWERRGKSD